MRIKRSPNTNGLELAGSDLFRTKVATRKAALQQVGDLLRARGLCVSRRSLTRCNLRPPSSRRTVQRRGFRRCSAVPLLP